jgi:hypothetical protein
MYKLFASGGAPRGWAVVSVFGRPARAIAALLAAVAPLAPALAQDGEGGAIHWAPSRGIAREWRFQADYLGPRQADRPIDVATATAAHVWRLPYGVQASLGLGVLQAEGERVDTNRPPVASDATGLLLGGGLRFAPVRIGPVEPFVEGMVHFLYTAGHPFPAEGTSVNGLVRWGGGVTLRLSERMSLEAGYRAAHLSNGGGLVPYNPAWNGRGGFIGLSWRPGRK